MHRQTSTSTWQLLFLERTAVCQISARTALCLSIIQKGRPYEASVYKLARVNNPFSIMHIWISDSYREGGLSRLLGDIVKYVRFYEPNRSLYIAASKIQWPLSFLLLEIIDILCSVYLCVTKIVYVFVYVYYYISFN